MPNDPADRNLAEAEANNECAREAISSFIYEAAIQNMKDNAKRSTIAKKFAREYKISQDDAANLLSEYAERFIEAIGN